jgi:hypothetical protein
VALEPQKGRAKEQILASVNVIATCFVPIPAVVEANKRRAEHWTLKKKRADERKEATWLTLRCMPTAMRQFVKYEIAKGPLLVRMTALSSHKPDDDNLAGALKHYRDTVANFLGVPDDSGQVTYQCAWERYRGKGPRGVRIEFIEWRTFLESEKARIAAELEGMRSK